MTLVKWYNRPARGDYFDPFFVSDHNKPCGCQPASNIFETSEFFAIELAVPGMSKEDFHLSLEKEVLTISSEKEVNTDENVNYTRREFQGGAFSRAYVVPKSVDVDKIEATYEQGILTVRLPKKEEAKASLSRQINVN